MKNTKVTSQCTPKWFSFCLCHWWFLSLCSCFGRLAISNRFRYISIRKTELKHTSMSIMPFKFNTKFATMLGMWIIPFLISVKFVHVRFLLIWIVFTTITSIIFMKATKTPISKSTPRWLYKWFLLVHKISYLLGVVGYIGLMLTFLGFNFLFFISPTVNKMI